MEKSKKTLQSLDKYLAVGFDADHCLARYKVAELLSILYLSTAKILVDEKNYPKEMLEYGKYEKCFIMNGLILDYETAYVIKLGENKIIARAYYGYERVSHEILKAKFGNPPKYEAFDPYKCRTESYLCCMSFYQCYIPPLLAHMVEYKKKIHHPEQINAREIVKDISFAEAQVDEQVLRDVVSGEICNQILYKQDKLKDILQKLKDKGKVLFIVSNAPSVFLDAVMKYAFGEEWNSLFDFIISSSKKPRFFTPQKTPFYELDSNFKRTGKEATILKSNTLYEGGNAQVLEENIARIAPEKSSRLLFFGDNYSTDILAAEQIAHWDGVCIIEELGDVDFGEGYDDSVWGHWQYEETPYGKIPSFWYSYMSKNVAMCTSLVDSFEMMSFYE